MKRSEPFLQTALPSPPLAGVHRAAANYPEDIPGVPISSGKPGPPSHTNPHPKIKTRFALAQRNLVQTPAVFLTVKSTVLPALCEKDNEKIILNVTIDGVRRCDKMAH